MTERCKKQRVDQLCIEIKQSNWTESVSSLWNSLECSGFNCCVNRITAPQVSAKGSRGPGSRVVGSVRWSVSFESYLTDYNLGRS